MNEYESCLEKAYRKWEAQHAFTYPSITRINEPSPPTKNYKPKDDGKRTIIILKTQILAHSAKAICIDFKYAPKPKKIWIPTSQCDITTRELSLEIKIPYKICRAKRIPRQYFRKNMFRGEDGLLKYLVKKD